MGESTPALADLASEFGDIDIYLFDQLLRARVTPGSRVLDTGCGTGRNLAYLMRVGVEVFGVDADSEAIAATRALAERVAPGLPPTNFRVEPVEAMTFPESFADFVISNAVLHFARDEAHFHAMLRGTWRVLKPDGLLFCRLASTIGCEREVEELRDRRFRLPDGTERFLVDEAMLLEAMSELGGRLADPLKTTVVQHRRSMTTWVTCNSA